MARASAVALAVALLALTGCGRTLGGADYSDSYHDLADDDGHVPAGPPALTLHRPEGDVALEPYTWCFQSENGSGGCADGGPPADPPATAAEGSVTFDFPLRGWSFTAHFVPPGPPTRCDEGLDVDVVDRGDGTYEIPAVGPAGRWAVDVSGYGHDGGDLVTRFAWTTATDATESPPATGTIDLLPPPSVGGDLEAYGPSLRLDGLDREPAAVTADVTLSDGPSSATYPLRPVDDPSCPHDGSLLLQGAHPNRPLALPELGDPPYAYQVRLDLDGTTYVGTGSWPADLDPPTSSSMRLTWDPPLPAWDGR